MSRKKGRNPVVKSATERVSESKSAKTTATAECSSSSTSKNKASDSRTLPFDTTSNTTVKESTAEAENLSSQSESIDLCTLTPDQIIKALKLCKFSKYADGTQIFAELAELIATKEAEYIQYIQSLLGDNYDLVSKKGKLRESGNITPVYWNDSKYKYFHWNGNRVERKQGPSKNEWMQGFSDQQKQFLSYDGKSKRRYWEKFLEDHFATLKDDQ